MLKVGSQCKSRLGPNPQTFLTFLVTCFFVYTNYRLSFRVCLYVRRNPYLSFRPQATLNAASP